MKVVSSMIVLCLCVGSAQAAGLLAKKQLQQPSYQQKVMQQHSGTEGASGLAPIPPQQFGKPLTREDVTHKLGHDDPNKAKAAKAKSPPQQVALKPTECTHPDCSAGMSLVEKPSGEQPSGEEGLAPIPPKHGSANIQNDHSTERAGKDARLGEIVNKAKGNIRGPKMAPTLCTHPDCVGALAPAKHAAALVEQPSAAAMARFDAEGPQQMAAAKAAGNCKTLANPTHILRCQEELENEASGVIGKAMAANKCGSLSKVEDITACLQLKKAKANVISAGAAASADHTVAFVSHQQQLMTTEEKKHEAILAKEEKKNAAILAKVEDLVPADEIVGMKTPAMKRWLAKVTSEGGQITLSHSFK